MSETKSTGAITGITNFLFLAFILPGIVYVCFILILFPFDSLEKLFPGLEMSIDVAVGAVITLGLALTSIVFTFDIVFRALWSLISSRGKGSSPKQIEYAVLIFDKDRERELGWYFWQLWGQSIMHENIAGGLAIVYFVYRLANNEIWPISTWSHCSWRDWTLVVIIANVICWRMFARWLSAVMSRL